MYRPHRKWAWNEQVEAKYREKRERLAAKGYVTDEDVCRYFAEQGADGYEPADVYPMMMDALCASAADRAIASLSQ